MWEIQAQQNYLLTPLPRATGLYAIKISPQVRIQKRKKLCESRTTLRSSSKERKHCKTYVQEHRILHGTSGKKTKWSLRFRKNAGALLTKNGTFLNVSYTTPEVFCSSERCSFWQNYYSILFWSFLQQLKVKNLSPNRHAWYSHVTKFALPLKWNQAEKTPSKQSVL